MLHDDRSLADDKYKKKTSYDNSTGNLYWALGQGLESRLECRRLFHLSGVARVFSGTISYTNDRILGCLPFAAHTKHEHLLRRDSRHCYCKKYHTASSGGGGGRWRSSSAACARTTRKQTAVSRSASTRCLPGTCNQQTHRQTHITTALAPPQKITSYNLVYATT